MIDVRPACNSIAVGGVTRGFIDRAAARCTNIPFLIIPVELLTKMSNTPNSILTFHKQMTPVTQSMC